MHMTALQKLKQKLDLIILTRDVHESLLQAVIDDINKNFIPLEKEQIKEAYRQGVHDYNQHEEGETIRSEEYYRKTYNRE
jgi:hypothetical protein